MRKIVLVFAIVISLFLGGCKDKKIKLPELDNKTKTEIEIILKDFDVEFNYFYDISEKDEVFSHYGDGFKVNDSLKKGDKVIVFLTVNKTKAPNLENKSKQEIITLFNEIGKEELNIELEFVNYYLSHLNETKEDLFYKYEDKEVGDQIQNNERVVIYLQSSTIVLPDLTNLRKESIITAFDKIGVYGSDVNLKFVDYFLDDVTSSDEGLFHKYETNFVKGDYFDKKELTVFLKSSTINIPNLNGKTKEEMIAIFNDMGISEEYLTFVPEDHAGVVPSTFIRYEKHKRGDEYFPYKGDKIKIYYDSRRLLPDLTGLNQKQILKELKEQSITNINFEYEINNDKEADTFSRYDHDLMPGDGIRTDQLLTIILYENNNYDEYKLIISKQMDGKNNNKALELYNFGNEELELSDYYLAILARGALSPTYTIELTGTLMANETHLLVKEGAEESLLDKANQVVDELFVGANNVVQLRNKHNDTYFDTIYDIGNVSLIFDNEIFVRRTETFLGEELKPKRIFNTKEWMGYIPEAIEILGTHPVDAETGPTFKLLADIFPDYGMTKMKFLSAADGDTVYFDSLDPRDTNSYKGDARIRFLMVDTPETDKPGVVGQPYANVATNFTRTLLGEASEIYLQADRNAGLIETYGRTLGLIWFKLDNPVTFNNIAKSGNVVISEGWHLLNYELLKYGLGISGIGKTGEYYNSPIFGNRYLYQWGQEAVWYAEANEYGLYSGVSRN